MSDPSIKIITVVKTVPDCFLAFNFGGDPIAFAVHLIEKRLKDDWDSLKESIQEKDYARARRIRADIKAYWTKMMFREGENQLKPSQRTMIEIALTNNFRAFELPFSLYRQFNFDLHRTLNSDSCKEKLALLLDDDWLQDLYDEYGLEALKRVKIPSGKVKVKSEETSQTS